LIHFGKKSALFIKLCAGECKYQDIVDGGDFIEGVGVVCGASSGHPSFVGKCVCSPCSHFQQLLLLAWRFASAIPFLNLKSGWLTQYNAQ
jgi:hypothetical protein